ncbi:mitochondrial sodium/calcium exchanger protein-like isoform X2 [Varroa jacobsoni]|uniref:Sodium/calcium exchanger membrane region domain-containing protein n=1 Tax=Varroa destructor TaxID=109461 RepID=A0A7M7JUC4_VARDE|nr:mitochondrial sodium/calcium exchanger protein-like isoform X2 [Varroa destructor]XP_022652593.1 mitochondrial sodium/calcium exchanger protein-like isoform X2 [Varroa destructor]XP_022652594.1 mitochondrial sodium/calcium exchanger protein-like isoform X2 [Varroa destructor]XP_022699284.1 mitochondrial sodium/calcium exchanger protein-like isoform X2 [Varroa jacobsoni]
MWIFRIGCELVHNYSHHLQCEFIKNTEECHEDENYIQYSTFVYCGFGSGEVVPALLLLILWIAILFIGLGVTADDFLTPALIAISNTLRLSQNIAGVTFLAFGNGAPDIISSLAGVQSARPELVIGELFGAGIFVTCAVTGSICLAQNFKITERPFLRDAIFYIGATYWAFCMFYKGQILLFYSIGFILLYFIYIAVVVASSTFYKRHKLNLDQQTKQSRDQLPGSLGSKFDRPDNPVQIGRSMDNETPPVDDPELLGVILRRSSFRDSYVRRRRRTLSGSRSQLNSHRFRFPTPNHSRANSLCSGFHFRGNSLGCEERLNKSRTNNSCLHEANPHQQQQRPRHNSFHRNGCTFRNPVHKLPAASVNEHQKLSSSFNGHSMDLPIGTHFVDFEQTDAQSSGLIINSAALSTMLTLDTALHICSNYENFQQEETRQEVESKVKIMDLPPLEEFLTQISPIDKENWHELNWFWKVFQIVKAPVYVILALTVPVVDENNHKNNWCRILNVLHCVTAPIAVMFNLKSLTFYVGNVPIIVIVSTAGMVIALAVWFTSCYDKPPPYHAAFGFAGFIVSVFWIYMLANEVVSLLKAVGIVLGLSDAFLGMTVLAWGNSVGDFISNLSVARQGFPRMAISACFGGPLLNLLLGFGLPYTWILLTDKESDSKLDYNVKIGLMYSTLCQSLISTMAIMLILGFHSRREFGAYLIFLYGVFFTAALILEILKF